MYLETGQNAKGGSTPCVVVVVAAFGPGGVDPPQQNQLTSTTAGGRPPSDNSYPLLLRGVSRGRLKIADDYHAHTENTTLLN